MRRKIFREAFIVLIETTALLALAGTLGIPQTSRKAGSAEAAVSFEESLRFEAASARAAAQKGSGVPRSSTLLHVVPARALKDLSQGSLGLTTSTAAVMRLLNEPRAVLSGTMMPDLLLLKHRIKSSPRWPVASRYCPLRSTSTTA